MQRREEFAAALAGGAAVVRRYFTLYVRPNGRPGARLGIIAGRQAARHAVDRNRVKRLVREVFRMNREPLGGVDVVVQVRRCPARNATTAARAELARLFADLGTHAEPGRSVTGPER